MAVAIRLRRQSALNRPYFKVVVTDTRSPRDGKFIEIVGTYDPKKVGQNSTLKLDRIEHWISKGAQPSDTVRSLIKKTKNPEAAAKKDAAKAAKKSAAAPNRRRPHYWPQRPNHSRDPRHAEQLGVASRPTRHARDRRVIFPYRFEIGRSALGVRRFFGMKIDILTLFPEICRAPLSESMMKRAQESKIVDLRIRNLRDWTTDKHHIVDDAPFGGGQGMVMKPESIFAAVEELKKKTIKNQQSKIILMSPAGRRFDQQMATDLSKQSHLIVICGHYEGVDHRVIEHLVDLEISIGDYVLTNGAIAAVVLVDAVVRLLPGALGHEHSAI